MLYGQEARDYKRRMQHYVDKAKKAAQTGTVEEFSFAIREFQKNLDARDPFLGSELFSKIKVPGISGSTGMDEAEDILAKGKLLTKELRTFHTRTKSLKRNPSNWKKIPAASQQGILDDLKSYGIKSSTKVLWGLLISKDPAVYFFVTKTRRKKDPYDAIMLGGSESKYVIEPSPTIEAAKRAGSFAAKYFEETMKNERRKNPMATGTLLALGIGYFLGKK